MLTSCSQLKALLNERPTPKSSFDACRLEAGITAPHAISWPSTHGFRTFLSKNQRWTVYRLPAEAGVPVRLTGRWWEFSFYLLCILWFPVFFHVVVFSNVLFSVYSLVVFYLRLLLLRRIT